MKKPYTADQETVRKVNTSIVLNTLRLNENISRADLAAMTRLNRSTVSNIVNQLIEEGLVSENESMDSKVGRPGIALTLKPDGGAVVGVELGVGFISVILTDFVGNILWKKRILISQSKPQIEIIGRAEEIVEEALSIAQEKALRPLGIGLGVPGLVNVKQGELIFAPNLGWRNVPLRLMWNQRFNLPLYVENEANLAALGEYYFGVGRDVDNFIYLSSDVGLGGGIIIDGKLFKGGYGFAGEIGHIQRDPNGEICGCGRRGCWETQVGPRAVLRRVRKELEKDPSNIPAMCKDGNLDNLTFNAIVKCALEGNQLCRKAVEDVGRNLGAGIADLANIFNPNLIIIGGAFQLGKEIILPVLEETVMSDALAPIKDDLRIIFSKHDEDACGLGAIAIVLDSILRQMTLV